MEKELSKRLSRWRSVRDSTRKTLYRLADRLDRKLQESKERKRNMAAVNLASELLVLMPKSVVVLKDLVAQTVSSVGDPSECQFLGYWCDSWAGPAYLVEFSYEILSAVFLLSTPVSRRHLSATSKDLDERNQVIKVTGNVIKEICFH
ncbi:hypothetical protein ACF0H5_002427 [Mactra antiquata]